MLFDTHAHYDSEAFDADREDLLAGLPGKGVGLVLCPGCDLPSSRACVELARRYSYVYAAVGIHPEQALDTPDGWLEELEDLARDANVKAIGEIGLDYYYEDNAPRDTQRDVFRAQLELAQKLNLPAIVHDREAHRDCLELVRAFPGVTGVYHCYSGSVEEAKVLVKLGWMISFTGNITFKNAKKAPEVIRWLPMDRIMIETDAPYMAPVPFRGQRCDSGYVYRVAETIAQLKGLSTEEVERITTENGTRFFRIEE